MSILKTLGYIIQSVSAAYVCPLKRMHFSVMQTQKKNHIWATENEYVFH